MFLAFSIELKAFAVVHLYHMRWLLTCVQYQMKLHLQLNQDLWPNFARLHITTDNAEVNFYQLAIIMLPKYQTPIHYLIPHTPLHYLESVPVRQPFFQYKL